VADPRQYNSTGGLTLTDDQRPWWALDHGNLGNYVIASSVGEAHVRRRRLLARGPGNGAARRCCGRRSRRTLGWCGLRQHGDLSVVDR
jgi:hypothetical protein